MFPGIKQLYSSSHRIRFAANRLLCVRSEAGSNTRRSKSPAFTPKKTDEKSEWWIVDGEMHEIGHHVPPRERFVNPRGNIPNRRRRQLREHFMRRNRLFLRESPTDMDDHDLNLDEQVVDDDHSLKDRLQDSDHEKPMLSPQQEGPAFGPVYTIKNPFLVGHRWIHSGPTMSTVDKDGEPPNQSGERTIFNESGGVKVKRKKLKGKRAVVRWLKFFRWKKKKEYERMTAEEKLLYKLKKARKKEERLLQSLKKIEPAESSETTHDPEILTPEEHFFFLKMGLKCKNYVPVGRRGIYQGVILNMHLHWKKHQTLKVVVKTFTPEEVKEIAAELARLTGGIVLDIHEENTIIMYRGKNYSQPPTEIMSPRVTLSRKKALDKSMYREGLRALRRHIPRLEQDLELLRAQHGGKSKTGTISIEEASSTYVDHAKPGSASSMLLDNSEKLEEILDGQDKCSDEESSTDLGMISDSEDLSDIFETDSDKEIQDKAKPPLYLDAFEKFPVEGNGEPEDFEEHLRQLVLDSKKVQSSEKNEYSPTFDEVDRMFLHAASLLKRKKR